MKPTVKLASLFLAVLMLFSVFASGCTLNKEWSYKTDDKTLAIGVYLTTLYESYMEAQEYASKLDGYDASSSKWLDMEITDDDGYTAVAKDWIKENAERKCLELLAIEARLEELGASADEATISSYETSMENAWYQSLKKTLEPKGVSLDSFKYYASRYSLEYEKLFDLLYGEDGSKRPGEEEIAKYFEEKYIEYTYLPVSLYQATTDEAGETKNELSDEEIKKLTDALDGIKENVNKSADAAAADTASQEAVAKFITDNGLTEDQSQTATSIKDKVSTGTDELDEAVKALEEGKAATLKVGEDEQAVYYYVYRFSTAKAKEDYLTDGTHDEEVIHAMKKMEFREYLADTIKDIGYKKSQYVGKYQPKMFFEKPKATSTDTSVITV